VCTSCHRDIGANVSAHTHHAEDSVGSNCYDCHMPKTTLGLLTVMRSHRIDNPTAAMSHERGRPNACNLCHLDRTLAQVADDLERWYGQKRPEGIDDEAPAAAIEWMISGNAVQRAVAVAHVAYPYVQETSGNDWLAPIVAHCLTDPYPAVRYIAGHALETLPGYAGFGSDYVADVVARELQRQRATDMWTPVDAPPATLVSAAGLDSARFEALVMKRDDSPVTVNE